MSLNLKETVKTPGRGWDDNIKTVPNRNGCEGKAWITQLIAISNYVTLLIRSLTSKFHRGRFFPDKCLIIDYSKKML